ncbi:carboxymuconolactone decarboxylase family protein [Caballeronia sp. GAFFF2]|uniref:carboxymuconolactone decarboxylase family protein n=1 Tax=Caballeronia sp. GAFFF2 TaxID=2921741 RepID=UPI002027D738|nr:carboxymuconolactone decarboxylase family protein [Caballeronia sp. GAFFF2]
MSSQWNDLVANNRKLSAVFQQNHPRMLSAFSELNEAQTGTGKLDAKTRELISLAVAVTTRCDGCIGSHAMAAVKAGASMEEVSEALGVAIALNAGAAYVHSLKALDAVGEFGAGAS